MQGDALRLLFAGVRQAALARRPDFLAGAPRAGRAASLRDVLGLPGERLRPRERRADRSPAGTPSRPSLPSGRRGRAPPIPPVSASTRSVRPKPLWPASSPPSGRIVPLGSPNSTPGSSVGFPFASSAHGPAKPAARLVQSRGHRVGRDRGRDVDQHRVALGREARRDRVGREHRVDAAERGDAGGIRVGADEQHDSSPRSVARFRYAARQAMWWLRRITTVPVPLRFRALGGEVQRLAATSHGPGNRWPSQVTAARMVRDHLRLAGLRHRTRSSSSPR